MRSGTFKASFLILVGVWIVACIAAGSAGATTPTIYDLPAATHTSLIAPAPDGTLWFVPSRGSQWEGESGSIVGSLAPDGTVAEHPVPGFGAIHRVAIGPSGGVWISGESGAHHEEVFEVARLSPTGELERRYIVGYGDGPYLSAIRSLAVTANAVWFVREWSSSPASIERLEPATGTVHRFTPTPGYRAYDLTVARDGAVWFTEGDSGRVRAGRVGPDGKVRRWQFGGKATRPVAITTGPEGTAWIGLGNARVGRIDRAGDLAQFKIPNARLTSLAVDGEGRVWFGSSFGGVDFRALNSIGIDGRLGHPVCADPACGLDPEGLVSAPDGGLWYGLQGPNLNTGGGSSGIFIQEEIANQTGSIGHLTR